MLTAPVSVYRGDQIHELTLKRVLSTFVPDIHFDMGATLGIWHPKINRWQGVFVRGRHVGAMGRGLLPEFNLYREETIADGINDGKKGYGELLEIGWRTTVHQVCKDTGTPEAWVVEALGSTLKQFSGTKEDWQREFAIPENMVDPIFNTLG